MAGDDDDGDDDDGGDAARNPPTNNDAWNNITAATTKRIMMAGRLGVAAAALEKARCYRKERMFGRGEIRNKYCRNVGT